MNCQYKKMKSRIFIYNDYKIPKCISDDYDFDNLKSELKNDFYLNESQYNYMKIINKENILLTNENFKELINNDNIFIIEITDFYEKLKKMKESLEEITENIAEQIKIIETKLDNSLNIFESVHLNKALNTFLIQLNNNINDIISEGKLININNKDPIIIKNNINNINVPLFVNNYSTYVNKSQSQRKIKFVSNEEKSEEEFEEIEIKDIPDVKNIYSRLNVFYPDINPFCKFKNERDTSMLTKVQKENKLQFQIWTEVLIDQNLDINKMSIPPGWFVQIFDVREINQCISFIHIPKKFRNIKPGDKKIIKVSVVLPNYINLKESNHVFRVKLTTNTGENISHNEQYISVSCDKRLLKLFRNNIH